MKTESLAVQEAFARGRALPWALVRGLSRVTLGTAPTEIDPEELIEARFFGAGEEIRVFRAGGELRAVRLCAEPEDNTLEQTYQIKNPRFGKSLTVCRLLEADGDGQMNVTATRLTGWEESV